MTTKKTKTRTAARCVAPGCGARAVAEVVEEGVLCPLCASHLAQWKEEGDFRPAPTSDTIGDFIAAWAPVRRRGGRR